MAAMVKKTTSLFPADILNYRGLQQKSKWTILEEEKGKGKNGHNLYKKKKNLELSLEAKWNQMVQETWVYLQVRNFIILQKICKDNWKFWT